MSTKTQFDLHSNMFACKFSLEMMRGKKIKFACTLWCINDIQFHALHCLLSLHSYRINPSPPPAFPSSLSHIVMWPCYWNEGNFFFCSLLAMITETVLKFNTYPQKINVHARIGDVGGGGGWWKDSEKNEKQNFLKKGNFAYKLLCYFSALKAFCNFKSLSLTFWVLS